MSVIDSQAERDAAVAKLAALDDEALRRDLAYWTVASGDHAHEYREAAAQMARVRALHAEAEGWVALIADELRGRRDRAREGAA